TFIGCDPNAAILGLEKRTDEVVHQTVFGRVVNEATRHFPIDALPLGAQPQRAIAIAKYITHAHAAQARKTIGLYVTLVVAKEVDGGNPHVAVAVLIHGVGIGIGGVRHLHGLDGALAQADHAGLGSDPEVAHSVLEEV